MKDEKLLLQNRYPQMVDSQLQEVMSLYKRGYTWGTYSVEHNIALMVHKNLPTTMVYEGSDYQGAWEYLPEFALYL